MKLKVLFPKILVEKIEDEKEGIVSATDSAFIKGKVIDASYKDENNILGTTVLFYKVDATRLPDYENYYVLNREDIIVYH